MIFSIFPEFVYFSQKYFSGFLEYFSGSGTGLPGFRVFLTMSVNISHFISLYRTGPLSSFSSTFENFSLGSIEIG